MYEVRGIFVYTTDIRVYTVDVNVCTLYDYTCAYVMHIGCIHIDIYILCEPTLIDANQTA